MIIFYRINYILLKLIFQILQLIWTREVWIYTKQLFHWPTHDYIFSLIYASSKPDFFKFVSIYSISHFKFFSIGKVTI